MSCIEFLWSFQTSSLYWLRYKLCILLSNARQFYSWRVQLPEIWEWVIQWLKNRHANAYICMHQENRFVCVVMLKQCWSTLSMLLLISISTLTPCYCYSVFRFYIRTILSNHHHPLYWLFDWKLRRFVDFVHIITWCDCRIFLVRPTLVVLTKLVRSSNSDILLSDFARWLLLPLATRIYNEWLNSNLLNWLNSPRIRHKTHFFKDIAIFLCFLT